MASLKKCVEAKCKECTYDQYAPGTWRDQVEACSVKTCPLWPVRPMTVATITMNRKSRGEGHDFSDILAGLEDETEEVA